MTTSPCYKCEDRNAGCHSTCEKYSDWKGIHSKELKDTRNNSKVIKPSDYAKNLTRKRKNK